MNSYLKRVFDIVTSGIALVIVLPLLMFVGLLIKIDSPGPVFYRQRRLGKRAKYFEIYKFRTMVHGSERAGPRITINGDPRVTRIGRILRRFDLDELPTLFNVFRGDMSVVGPRPEVPEYLRFYTEKQKQVFSVKPGLTDFGTLVYRNEAVHLQGENAEQVYIREILPRKLALNLEYMRKQNFFRDLTIVFRTFVAILFQPKA